MTLNSLPAIVVEAVHDIENIARRFTIHCDVDEAGHIRKLYTVAAPKKLAAVPAA